MILVSDDKNKTIYDLDQDTNDVTVISPDGKIPAPDGTYSVTATLVIKDGKLTNGDQIDGDTPEPDDSDDDNDNDTSADTNTDTDTDTDNAKLSKEVNTTKNVEKLSKKNYDEKLNEISVKLQKYEENLEKFSKLLEEKEENIKKLEKTNVKLNEELGSKPSVQPTALNKQIENTTSPIVDRKDPDYAFFAQVIGKK